MSPQARLVWYLIALVLFIVATILSLVESKRITWSALVAAGLACLTVVPFWIAVQES